MKNVILLIIFFAVGGEYLVAQEVILIRHAEVHHEREGWITSKKAAQYRANYDTAPIHQFNPDTVLAKIPQRIADTVFVSGLPRSIATGIKLYGDSAQIVSLTMLNEFEMHVAWLPLILPYKAWTSFSRALWIMGWEKQGTESYAEAKDRVNSVANFIEKRVRDEKQIIMVTHGFINRNIAKELQRRDWTIIQNEGKKNLGATILRKVQKENYTDYEKH